jgi:hypothetical protein
MSGCISCAQSIRLGRAISTALEKSFQAWEYLGVSTVAPMSEFIKQIKGGRRPTFQEIVRETKDPAVLGGRPR